ncbi:MAG: phycobiliprotein lyase [Phormidesmis sp. RL_2_1]|nr:phycobiliprotein lyase [Phormidesmis sp. RL_2_1]
MSALDIFYKFFDSCVGTWNSERTYHYLSKSAVERSHTNFGVSPLSAEQKAKVLADNHYSADSSRIQTCPGFHLVFHTVSEKGEVVDQSVNLAFVPSDQPAEHEYLLEGDYLRDRAYEEDRPIIAHFRFNSRTCELLMTTRYTQIVSVDSITLINPNLRIRRIFNYMKAPDGQPLSELALVGFGVEQKLAG